MICGLIRLTKPWAINSGEIILQTLSFLAIQIILLFIVTSVHTYLGLHIIRRGIIFCDLVLDQLAAFGVIVGIGIGIRGGTIGSYLLSFLAVLFGSYILAYVKPKNRSIPHEAVIGITYGLALVTSLLAADKMTGGAAYVTQTLSGCMLWINWPLVWITAICYLLLGLFHFRFRKRFISITEGSVIKNENRWDLLFFITQGIITVLIVPIAGVLLAYSFLMIPAAIALLFTHDWKHSLYIGWATGFLASIAGLFSSYHFDLPYGPSLVLALGVFFFGAIIIRLILPAATTQN